jgi:uncharacterized membrane protein SpoIIM required for sporulation
MKQQAFEERYAREWQEFEAWLDRRDKVRHAGQKLVASPPFDDAEIPHRYRRICQLLALARDRHYGADVIERLHRLAVRGHRLLYGVRGDRRNRFLLFAFGGFSRLVRRERRTVALAALLFMGPLAAMIGVLQLYPDFVHYLLDPGQIASFEAMYKPDAARLGRTPEADSSFLMFGYYVWNNVKIAFQTFAGGLLFGIGTLFFLLFNGFVIGAVAGHLTRIGYSEPFYSFVSGHSALELTAIVLAGAAGLKLGAALVAPGQLSRKQALIGAARGAGGLIYGAAGMLLLAAFVEAFWSPLTEVPPQLKYGVGIALWVALGAYFLLLGRSRGT